MKWITLYLLTLCFPTTRAGCNSQVIIECIRQVNVTGIECYENDNSTCRPRSQFHDTVKVNVIASVQVEIRPTSNHEVRIPLSALRKRKRIQSKETVQVVASVINITVFQNISGTQPTVEGTVLGGQVLCVNVGNQRIINLTEPVQLIFYHNKMENNGTCVFWKEDETEWSSEGCSTTKTEDEFICSCDHLSFFAVLVNPDLKVDEDHVKALSYITYVGSALSAFFAFISLFVYVGLHRRRSEKALSIHMQLTGALLCLHLGFLSGSFWSFLPDENKYSWVCGGLGLFLHWSLLATLTWVAVEGFHLYLLLIRVFNIYVRRYLLKLCLVGWGFPTLVVAICGPLRVYGRYTLKWRDSNNQTSEICWMNSDIPQTKLVTYITVAFLCLVVLYNTCMLLLVVFKMRELRRGRGERESSDWKKMSKEKESRLWKDGVTVLGLSCVLGLPWGLAILTYVNLPGIYLFTIFNSLQGLFIFLWSVALSCKSRSENNSSVRDPSTQKMMTTSSNN
ncbi:adhesion G protein-coupled receptor G3-like [Xiphophorus hellerii]|uniref:adhesion G protein-coupled receptor G3-like n=1 Tax=Xiphophorus hellerii TaxID=8084 RepID=UPI0013B40914|nr:adhesion G protein-coupled receptor G3-like [Xiphophorus hellerii]